MKRFIRRSPLPLRRFRRTWRSKFLPRWRPRPRPYPRRLLPLHLPKSWRRRRVRHSHCPLHVLLRLLPRVLRRTSPLQRRWQWRPRKPLGHPRLPSLRTRTCTTRPRRRRRRWRFGWECCCRSSSRDHLPRKWSLHVIIQSLHSHRRCVIRMDAQAPRQTHRWMR